MNQTDTTDGGTPPPFEHTGGENLPPYSGELTTCIKCSYREAFTVYQRACTRRLIEQNNHIAVRGPLPERLQRACQRCSFEWDEALAPSPAAPPATVEDIAYALRFAAPNLFGKGSVLAAGHLHDLFAMTLRPEAWTVEGEVWILREQQAEPPQEPAPLVTVAAPAPPFTLTDVQPADSPITHGPDAEQ